MSRMDALRKIKRDELIEAMADACAAMWAWLAEPENVGKLKKEYLQLNTPKEFWPDRHCYYCDLCHRDCSICLGNGIIWHWDDEYSEPMPCVRHKDSPYKKWENATTVLRSSRDEEWEGDASILPELEYAVLANAKIMAERTQAIANLVREGTL